MSDRGHIDERAALYRELLEREQRLQELIGRLLDQEEAREVRTAPPAARLTIQLTPREVEMLRLLAAGQTNRQIGMHLRLGAGTVRNYLGRIFRKLGVTTRTHAAVRAVELGLVRPGDTPLQGPVRSS